MSSMIASRYAQAVINDKDVKNISQQLQEISQAYQSKKFITILETKDIPIDKKEELLISFVKNCSKTTVNLIKLMAQNGRLDMLHRVSKELKDELSKRDRTYEGEVFSKDSLTKEQLSYLEKSLSKKFDIDLTLHKSKSEFDGVKVKIDGLDIEVGFSKENFKDRLKRHILKAI